MKVMPVKEGISQRTGNAWKSQEIVFEYFEQDDQRFADRAVLQIRGEDRINGYDVHEGDECKIGFEHKAREYQGRYFNELNVYRLQKVKAADAKEQEMPFINQDDLPFD